MKAISLREAQLLELDILLELVRYCEQHRLTYYLAYGTLLGAVRHQGFIPGTMISMCGCRGRTMTG